MRRPVTPPLLLLLPPQVMIETILTPDRLVVPLVNTDASGYSNLLCHTFTSRRPARSPRQLSLHHERFIKPYQTESVSRLVVIIHRDHKAPSIYPPPGTGRSRSTP